MKTIDIRLVVDDSATSEDVAMVIADINEPEQNWKAYGAVPLKNRGYGSLTPDMDEAYTWTCGSQETETDRLLRHGQ